MFASRLKLLALALLVALAVYSTPTYNYAKTNHCNALTLFRSHLFIRSNFNYLNAQFTALEHIDQLDRPERQTFRTDEISEIASLWGGVPAHETLRKYRQLSTLNKAERNVSFNLMSAEDKSSMWSVHFRLNLARHPEWTEQQRAIVFEAIALVTPELYKTSTDNSWTSLVDEPVRLFTQKALQSFGKEEGAALFSELGSVEKSESNHARPQTTRNCGCSQESDWCSNQCVSSDCTVLTWGCGTFGVYACNGRCYTPAPK